MCYIHPPGLREIFYGKRLEGAPHVARYVEHFYRNASPPSSESGEAGSGLKKGPLELWIVFHDEGTSLRRFLYSPHERRGGARPKRNGVLFEPSDFWRQLRTAEGGPEVIRGLMRQIVEGAAEVHATGAAHRDLKPSNIIVSLEGGAARVKIADFSSAVDGEALERGLYGGGGPSQAEETKEYMPPEVWYDAMCVHVRTYRQRGIRYRDKTDLLVGWITDARPTHRPRRCSSTPPSPSSWGTRSRTTPGPSA